MLNEVSKHTVIHCKVLFCTCKQGVLVKLSSGCSERWRAPVCCSETAKEQTSKWLFVLAQRGLVPHCTVKDRWMWALEVGFVHTYILIMTSTHTHPHIGCTTHTAPQVDPFPEYFGTEPAACTVQTVCSLDVWFGIASRLETCHVTSGKTGSHQTNVWMKKNRDIDSLYYKLQNKVGHSQ